MIYIEYNSTIFESIISLLSSIKNNIKMYIFWYSFVSLMEKINEKEYLNIIIFRNILKNLIIKIKEDKNNVAYKNVF